MKKTKNLTIELPLNYRGVFKHTYRYSFTFIMKLSLLLSLFFIPTLVWIYLSGLLEGAVIHKFASDGSLVQWQALLLHRQTFVWLIIPCFLIGSIGLAGSLYVMKRQITNDGVVLLSDFKEGIIRNWKRYLLFALFYSVIISFLFFVPNLFYHPDQMTLYISIFSFSAIISFLLIISMLYAMQLNQTYDAKFSECIFKSFLFVFAEFPKNILLFIITILPFIAFIFINNLLFPTVQILTWITYLLYAILGLGHTILLISLFQHYAMDKYINKSQFPEIYRKGLYNEKDE